jgi:hypothetical protein
MELSALSKLPPWEWPEEAGSILTRVILDHDADAEDRTLAAEMAGDITVINDDLIGVLLGVLADTTEPAELRGMCAIATGPVLEYAYTTGFEENSYDAPPISEQTYDTIHEDLYARFVDEDEDMEVRRRALEASVRAPQDWHRGAITAVHASGDEAWYLTAVFCMSYVNGFDEQIIAAMDHADIEVQVEAIRAAGTWALDAAWDKITPLFEAEEVDKEVLMVAIDAAAQIRRGEAAKLLVHLTDIDDEDVVEAVHDALTLTEEGDWDEDVEGVD